MTKRTADPTTAEQREWRRYREQLVAAVKAVDAAQDTWARWGAEVRERREKDLDVPAFNEDGTMPAELIEDPVYGAALDVGHPFREAIDALRRATEAADEWERKSTP